MDWNEEDDDWNDDVLANIDSIIAQHQSKQQLASQMPSSPENQRPSAAALQAPVAAANGHHMPGPATAPPLQAQARSLGLPPPAVRGQPQAQPWQQPHPQQQWGHQPSHGAIPMTSSSTQGVGRPSEQQGRFPLQRLPMHRSLGQQLASHPDAAAAAAAAAAAKVATNPHPHNLHQHQWGHPPQQAAHPHHHQQQQLPQHQQYQHQHQHQQPQQRYQPAPELQSAAVMAGSGIGSLILAELSQPLPSAPAAPPARPGLAAPLAVASVGDVAMSEAGAAPSSSAQPLLALQAEVERWQQEAQAARQASEELRLRAERAERQNLQLQLQQPSQSLQGDYQRQLEALQQQLMFAQEEMAGNRRRASERESRLTETQGRVGTLERDLRRREEQLVQLEEELRLARERLLSPASKHQNQHQPPRAAGSQGRATAAAPQATPQWPHAAAHPALDEAAEDDPGTMDVELLPRGTLQDPLASSLTPGPRPGFNGGGGASTSSLQSLLSTAYLWQPSIWQKLWSTCPSELACFASDPGVDRGAGAASAAAGPSSGSEGPAATASPAASSLPATVAAAHSRVSAALTDLSQHCTAADSASHPSSSGPSPSLASRLMLASSLQQQQQQQRPGTSRPLVAARVLQELLCLLAALLGAGAAQPGAGGAVRSELLRALGLLRSLVRLGGLSAATSASSPRDCLDQFCRLSAPASPASSSTEPAPPDQPPLLVDRLGLAALELLSLLHLSQLSDPEGLLQQQQRRGGSRRGSEDGSERGPSSPGAALLQALGGALTEVLASLLSPARVQEVAPSLLQSDLLHDLLCSPLSRHGMLGLQALQLLMHRSPLARSELQQAWTGSGGGEELPPSLQGPSSTDRLRQLAAGVLECLSAATSPECGPPVTSRSSGVFSLQRGALCLLAQMLEQGQEGELAALCCAPWLPFSGGLGQRLLQLADAALSVPADQPSVAAAAAAILLPLAPLPERCRLAQEALLLSCDELRACTLHDLTSESEAVSLLYCATSRLASVRDSWRDLHLPPGTSQQHAWPEVLLAPWAQRLLRSTVVAGRGQPLAAGAQAGCGLEAVIALNSSITRRSLHRLQHAQLTVTATAAQAADPEQQEQQQRRQARQPVQ